MPLGTSNILEGNEADVKNVNVGLESLGKGEEGGEGRTGCLIYRRQLLSLEAQIIPSGQLFSETFFVRNAIRGQNLEIDI